MSLHTNTLRELYRNGSGAILTSLTCSLCTFTMSQVVVGLMVDKNRSAEMQSAYSVAIFVVGYWIVYFAIRERLHSYISRILARPDDCKSLGGPGAKLFFVCASEIFWVVSLGGANLYLLHMGYSANTAAAVAQWGINLFIWLPVLPIWEWFAMTYLPTRLGTFFTR